MRRRDLLLGASAAALTAPAAAQPVPFTGAYKRTLGPNGGSLGPVTGGTNPTIDLNFITGAASFTTGSFLDSRITFSRADVLANASYYDATGVLRYGPTNIMTQSQDQTAWTLTNVTATLASGTAPDGSVTMNRIAETATTSTHYINRNIAVVASTVYTVSIYAKAAERQYLQINYDDGTNGAYATFDLTGGTITGALTAKGSGTAVGAAITAIGNGIYRCSITASHGSTTGRMLVSLATTANPAVAPSYAGNASNGLLVWGAQLDLGTAPGPYVATVGAALSGPRFDYSPATVTNWVRNNSMAGANATGNVFPTFWLHGENTTLAPTIVGVGTETGIPYVDIQISGAATAGNNNIFFDAPAAIQALTGQTWTHSVYLRIVGGSTTNLNQVYVSMQMRDSAGSGLSSFTSNVLASLNGNALAGNRFTLTSALNNASTAFVQPWIQINPQSAAINITLRIGAPQLEQAASANTFVPTYGTFAGSGGTLRGLLIEEARANLAFPSNLPATLFTASASTLTATQGTAPDGTITMARLAEDATTATHYANKSFTVTASGIYTFSIYAQAQQDTFLQLFYDDGTGVNGCYANFNLTTGAIAQAIAAFGAGTATGASIQAAGNGIYRCSITGVATSSTTGRCGVVLAQVFNASFATVYAGSTSNGLLVWGAQFELSTATGIPTSYIPTVSGNVTRANDIATLALSPPASFSLAVDFMVPLTGPSGTILGLASVDDGTTANRISARIQNGLFAAAVAVGGVTLAQPSGGAVTINAAQKIGYTSSNGTTLLLAGNGTVGTTVVAQPTGLTTLRIGANAPASGLLDGWVRRVRYYPQALTSAQLTQITT